MTLRFFVESGSEGGVVALHGRLGAEEVEELEKVVAEAGPSPRIDLAYLSGVDAAGLRVLGRLKARGAYLCNVPGYAALMLERAVAGDGDEAKG